jgi:hypothetical protein
MGNPIGSEAVQDRFLSKRILADTYSLMLRLRGERNRLEAFIRWTAGPVIGGIKPAAMVRIPRDGMDRSLDVWGEEICQTLDLSVLPLRESAAGVLVLLYRRRLLRKTLVGASGRYLGAFSYPVKTGIDKCLEKLQDRFSGSEQFPHEVGIFLGYPLEDVISFSSGKVGAFACRGYWKVYHRPEKAERTFARMDRVRIKILGDFFTPGKFSGTPGINRAISGCGLLQNTSLGKPLSASEDIWVI